ncbi:hypothetical protein [Bacillus sp. JJ1122]|uniref:hypothetical protein n=1 Tax=Bacillus sp. JJ1122 TaxID=3122951 RepID=UPI003000E137
MFLNLLILILYNWMVGSPFEKVFSTVETVFSPVGMILSTVKTVLSPVGIILSTVEPIS